jgi:hypothetical protein
VAKAMSMAKQRDMGKEVGVAYHAGAVKYYKEKGWIK